MPAEPSPTRGAVDLQVPREYANVLDAAAGGAGVGLKLAANVGAMLLAFISLVAMVNYGLGFVGLSLQQIFGWVFSPLAWVMGVPWGETGYVGGELLRIFGAQRDDVARDALEQLGLGFPVGKAHQLAGREQGLVDAISGLEGVDEQLEQLRAGAETTAAIGLEQALDRDASERDTSERDATGRA